MNAIFSEFLGKKVCSSSYWLFLQLIIQKTYPIKSILTLPSFSKADNMWPNRVALEDAGFGLMTMEQLESLGFFC